MQEFREQDGGIRQEFYEAFDGAELDRMMDADITIQAERGRPFIRRVKVGRNETCPCGSGIKFKKCCLSKAQTA